MFDETIARPTFISEEMNFLTPVDTGGPTPDLEWFEADIIYNDEIIRPGVSTSDSGSNLEVGSSIDIEWSAPGRLGNILVYMIIIVPLFIGFAVIGMGLFGSHVESYRSFGNAIISVLLLTMG